MKKKLILCWLFAGFLGQIVNAQKRYDLSADMLGPLLRNRYSMSFEYIPKGNVGLEFSLISVKHNQESWYFPNYPSTGGVIIDYYPISLGAHDEYVTGVTVAAKFYLSRKKNGSGLFGGGLVENYTYTGASEAAKQSYQKIYSADLPRNLRTAAGFILGYKALIYKRLTLEAKAKGTFMLYSDYRENYSDNTIYFNYADDTVSLFISLGYRF